MMDCEDPDMSKNFFVRNSLYVTGIVFQFATV